MTLTEIKSILAQRGIQLTKSLGQNFMHDGNQIRRMVAAAELRRGDRVLEIGPGLGPLTEVILEHADQLLAIEKDHRLFECLHARFDAKPGFQLRGGDALEFIRSEPQDWSGWKVVANLPYSVASPILVELAATEFPPARITVTLQREVAERVAARANDDDYGVLSLLVQFRYEPADLFKIPAACFFPAPDVDSACVTLVRREVPLVDRDQAALFARIVKRGFSQRRKMMLKLLRQEWPDAAIKSAYEEAGLDAAQRAETVSLEQFATLTRRLAPLRKG
jgi:16S rRNA (adenine1518-N6/adenine1519-N6)-dimethyltransferase